MAKLNHNYRTKAKVKPSVDGILGLISFSTRIPVKRYIEIEQMSGSVIVWPYIGLGIGIIASILAYIFLELCGFSNLLAAALTYGFICWFTGFNHVDSVLDMGDGLMAHGEPSKRLSIMRDSMVGAGGIATFFIVASLSVISIASVPSNYLLQSIILMELCAKLSMVTSMVFGSSDSEGIGQEIKKGMDYKVLLFTIIVSLVIGCLLLDVVGIMAVLVSTITGLYLSVVAQKTFGCVTGDVLGSSNEIAKIVSLLFIILNLNIIA